MTLTATTLRLPFDIGEASDPAADTDARALLIEAAHLDSEWSRAREMWLAGRKSENTRRAYRAALDEFVDAIAVTPWSVNAGHIIAWIASMRAAGRSEATIRQRLAACSSFYHFVCTRTGDSSDVPLCRVNPFLEVERPKVEAYQMASCLSPEQAGALLRAIPSDTLQGQRDYALLLTYLSTGRRNSDVRLLKWGDIVEQEGRVCYCWNGKGEDHCDELPFESWAAIQAYLQASGRIATMGEGEYIFTALTDRAARLKNVDAASWNPRAQPLSAREVGRLLKRYARRAGLDSAQVRVSTLRRTAAHLRREAGAAAFQAAAWER